MGHFYLKDGGSRLLQNISNHQHDDDDVNLWGHISQLQKSQYLSYCKLRADTDHYIA